MIKNKTKNQVRLGNGNPAAAAGAAAMQLVSHLKKSFLQYSFPSREKHLSVKVHLQSQHWTHLMCHGLSRTLSRNRSTMGFSQLAQYSIACLRTAVILQKHTQTTTTTKTTPSRSPHKSKRIRSVASSAASCGCVWSLGSTTILVRPCGTSARRTAASQKQLRGHDSLFLFLLLFRKKMLSVLALRNASRVQREKVKQRWARAQHVHVYPCSAAATSSHVWRRRRNERTFFKSLAYCPLRGL